MKKFIVAAIIIGSFILYSLMYAHTNPVAIVPNSSTDSASSNSSTDASSISATPAASSANPTPAAPGVTVTVAPGALYKDGSYTGSLADAHWGNIQVKAVIQNGKITDVQFLQYPNERNRSVMINNYADPQLTSEAIQAQSANVDIVTGATDTSEAFIQSLSDALSQAKA
ncbi:MAG TPA: FMN-binding protein [Ktedonobacteraceae bacterium]|nr:FMN-binding protein [Ktedonobacteraceae bacterium]